MDVLLGKLTSQAMNYAIRSGIAITSTYAINQCTRLLKQTPQANQHRQELLQVQLRLESKIRIISPAIDMIELISARGNTTLESAVNLTKGIRGEIQRLGNRIAGCIARQGSKDSEVKLLAIIQTIKALLARIEDAVPLINLAITTSGVNLTTKLSGTISPSRLLQASTFLTAADTNYTASTQSGKPSRQQIGPTWTLSLYMLFAGHASRAVGEPGVRGTTWKEVVHKARVKLVRVPLDDIYSQPGEQCDIARQVDIMPGLDVGSEFAYQLVIIEDLDDDRVHMFEEEEGSYCGPIEDVLDAGMRDVVPIHQISRIFYADTGKILNIGSDDEVNNPVLLIKRDVRAEPPRRMLHRSQMPTCGYYTDLEIKEDTMAKGPQTEINSQIHRESTPNTPLRGIQSSPPSKRRLPANLDPEWMAFEVYFEEPDSEIESEEITNPSRPSSSHRGDSLGPELTGAFSNFKLDSPSRAFDTQAHSSPLPRIKTSLSLLEMLIKLTALQQFRQDSHLAIEDELLNFFLEESATAGAGSDKEFRRKLRNEAVSRVGFDPYDESPVKRRGEEYMSHARGRADRDSPQGGSTRLSGLKDDRSLSSPPEFVRPSIELACSVYGSPPTPSPRALLGQQTPLRAPAYSNLNHTAERHSREISTERKIPKAQSQMPLLATPPSTTKHAQAVWRAQSEPKTRSPLAPELIEKDFDSEEAVEDVSIEQLAEQN